MMNQGDFSIDKSLSGKRVKVYHNPETNQTIVAHRGTHNLKDWGTDLGMTFGYEGGKRFKHSKKVQRKAEKKYGTENLSTIGHSLGARLAEKYGQKGNEVITLNKPIIPKTFGKKISDKQYDIRTSFDPVSALHFTQDNEKMKSIHSDTYNPLTEHGVDVLNRSDEIYGRGFLENIDRRIKHLEPIVKATGQHKDKLSELFKIKYGTIKRMKGGMVGGMPYRDINDKNKNIYEYYNENDDTPELVNIDDFIDAKDNFTNDEEYKKVLLQHLKEIPELLIDSYIENNTEYENRLIDEFHKLTNEAKNLNLTKEENRERRKVTKDILDIQQKSVNELKKERTNRNNTNVFYNKVDTLAENSANDVVNKYKNGSDIEKNEIANKWLGENNQYNQDRIYFESIPNINDKIDYLKNKIQIYEKGNKTEDKLIDKDILLSFIDKDFSDIKNTKDETSLNPSFIQKLKDIGMNSDDIKEQVLDKINIDGIKKDTLWEIKAFGKNSYNNENFDRYSKAKFRGSEPFIIRVNKTNSKNFDLYEVKYYFNIDYINGKVKNINYTLNKKLPKWEGSGNKLISAGYILNNNPNGYNYYILENNKDVIQYTNPLKTENWNDINNQLKNTTKNKIKIPNTDFIKFPIQYIENYEKVRLKKNNRQDKKNIYKNWDKI
jgi:hypothetical protein